MAYVEVPDRAAGYAPQESDWDLLKDNMNAATWVKLGNTTLTGSAAEIEFASLDLTFSHLVVVAYLASTTGAGAQTLLRINSDSGSNYDFQELYAAGGSVNTPAEGFGQTSIRAGYMSGSTHTNIFSPHRIIIPAYAQTSGHKAALCRSGLKTGTSTTNLRSSRHAGFWRSTTVVSNVKLIPSSGSLAAGSRATLYALA